jgi:hypothetical protein
VSGRKKKKRRKPRRVRREMQASVLSLIGGVIASSFFRAAERYGAEIRARMKQRKKGAEVNGKNARLEGNVCPPRVTVH